MGNSESPTSQKPDQQIINHPKFSTAALTKDNEYITITLPIENDTDFYIWEENLNSITELDDETFLLPKAYEYERNSICGHSGTLKIQFDNFPYILHDEIQNRRTFDKHFEEEEIWYLLYSLITSAHRFHRMNKKVGDIRPKNIFINDSGQVKVTNFYSWPSQQNNVSKTMVEKIVTFLAPEEMEEINAGKIQTVIDRKLAESFSVGLTILNTGLLDMIQGIYNTGVYKCDIFHLEKKLNNWMKLEFKSEQKQRILHYSNPLKEVILALCSANPKHRISCSEIYYWLEPFDQQIINLQQFEIGRPPVKKLQLNYHDSRDNHHKDFVLQQIPRNQLKSHIAGISQQKVQLKVDTIKAKSLQKHQNDPYKNSRHSQQQTANINHSQMTHKSQNPFPPVDFRSNSYQINQVLKANFVGNANRLVSINQPPAFNSVGFMAPPTHPPKNTIPLSQLSQNQIPDRFPMQPVTQNQRNFTTTVQTRETYTSSVEDNDFLKKINEQLRISKKMYP